MASLSKLTLGDNIDSGNKEFFIYKSEKSNNNYKEIERIASEYGYELTDSSDKSMINNATNTGLTTTSINILFKSNNLNSLNSAQNDGTTANNMPVSLTVASGNISNGSIQYAFFTSYTDSQNILNKRKLELLEFNSNTTYNQQSALKYIFYFFMVISLYTFFTNFDKLSLTHGIIYIIFILYAFFFDSISTILLNNFRTSFNELKYATAATQIITYLKILAVIFFTFLLPAFVFSAFSDTPIIPFMDITNNMKANDAIDNVKSNASDNMPSFNDNISNTIKNISDETNNIVDAIDDTAKKTVESVNDSIPELPETLKMEKNGGRRRRR